MKANYKSINLIGILCLMLALGCPGESHAKLVGKKYSLQLQDTAFKNPYIDIDEVRTSPSKHRYIHGGFDNGTKFSLYLPTKAKDFTGRFFQYVTPFPDSETVAQNANGSYNMIGFSVENGAGFLETNGGGSTDFTTNTRPEATIGAYRSHAACAELSRAIMKDLYGCDRAYGYVFGGSGGAYRTLGYIENTTTWDGAVPFVLGSPSAIPNVFAVRMHALRILWDKLPQIVDALEPGGSGDPYAGLNQEEYEALKEATAMGFPMKSWYGYKEMDVHGFLVLYKSIVQMDPQYFHHDFWNEHGYLGANPTPSLLKARIQQPTTIAEIYTQDQAETLGLVAPMDPADKGSADRAWDAAGNAGTGQPVAFRLADQIGDIGMGGDLVLNNGDNAGTALQLRASRDNYVVLAPTNGLDILAKIRVGDAVTVDNSDFLAVQTYFRHQVPDPQYYVWDYERDNQGNPKYPQRPMLLGPIFTMGASGCLPAGNINGKVILLCSLYDREAFPWQGDWYRKRIKETQGNQADNMFRLWYTDRALHGDGEGQLGDCTHAVSYNGVLQQALLDISDWVERGIAPAETTNYTIVDGGQVEVPTTADERRGIQPVVNATINGEKMITVAPGQEFEIAAVAEVPQGMGKVVRAEWSHDGATYTATTDLATEGRYSNNGNRVEFSRKYSFDTPGTYFVALRVTSQRNGKDQLYTPIANIDRVRVVVK
ncbi:MAG: hypothetical protein LUD17_16405 [Bacteroidales bacterium]|nr:hypothetical protein [Bacteroidales bacterium]